MRNVSLGIRTRIFGGNGVLVVLSLALAGFGAWQLMSIDEQVRGMNALSADRTLVLQAGQQVERVGRTTADYRTAGNADALAKSREAGQTAMELLADAGKVTPSAERRDAYLKLTDDIKQYRSMQDDLASRFGQLARERNQMRTAGEALSASMSKFVEGIGAGTDANATAAANRAENSLLLVRLASWQFLAVNDAKTKDAFKADVEKAYDALSALDQMNLPDALGDELAAVEAALGAYDDGFSALSMDTLSTATMFDTRILPLMDAVLGKLEAIQTEQQRAFAATNAETRAAIAETVTLQELMGVLALVLGAAIAWVIGRSISRPVLAMTTAMTRLADGDITVTIPATESRDEMGAMAKAVEVFRHNAIEREQVEARQKEQEERAALEKREAMHALANAFGRLDRAEATIRRIAAGRHRMHALADLAAASAEAGREVRASVHAAEVERMARRTSDPRRLAVLAARVAEGLTAVGDREAARRLAERITDSTQRGTVLTRVAEACADSGDVATAEEIAGSLSEPERRTWVLVSVCTAHGAAGRRREAIDAASAAAAGLDRINDRYSRVVALIRLYRALRAVGADRDAEHVVAVAGLVLDDITDSSQRARALAQLAIAAADAGDQSRADDLDKQFEDALPLLDGGRRDRVLARRAQMLGEAGRAEQAAEVAVVIVDPVRRVRALAAAAGAARDGDRAWALLSRAEADLELIGDPDERAGAMGRLAGSAAAVLEAGDASGPADQRRTWLRKLVAELLISDAWIEVVPVIAWLDRAAFDAVVAWLSARVGVLEDDEPKPATQFFAKS